MALHSTRPATKTPLSKATLAFLLLLGTFAGATSIIFIKASRIDPVVLSAHRLMVAVVALSPLFLRDLYRHRERYGGAELRRTLLPGVVLALHFISWIAGARLTLAVNSSLIVNMVPVVSPLLLFFIAREVVVRKEWLGTVLSLAGVLLLTAADYHLHPQYFAGDALCFGSMLLFAVYLILGRRNRDFPSIWLYVVPLYAFAAFGCYAISFAFKSPFEEDYPIREVLLILGLGLVPTVFGHSILNLAMKYLRGQVVSVANLAQPVHAGLLAFLFLNEVPTAVFYPACALILAGVVAAFR